MAEIPKIVGQRLQAIATLGEHPDANLLGGFAERSLSRHEQVEVMRHLSQCTDCREILSLSVTQPQAEGAPSLAVPVSPARVFWPVLRWGAAVACVVVIGAAVTLHERRELRTVVQIKPAEVSLSASNGTASNSPTEKRGASLATPNSEAKTAFSAAGQKEIMGNPAEATHTAADSKPVEMADGRSGSPFAQVVPGRAKNALAEPVAKKRFADEPTGTTNPGGDALLATKLAPRWTLNSDGTLQRSLDSGRNWQTIPVANQMIFRALAANGLDIWVGGAAGALFHSSDAGEHWMQVRPAANGETLAGDIIGVEFTDALHGKLTSSLEETWVTADAGQTWQRQ